MRRALACFAFALVSFGCADLQKQLDDGARAIKAASTLADRAEPFLFAAYEDAIGQCSDDSDCVEGVRADFADVREALEIVREVRCSVSPGECTSP